MEPTVKMKTKLKSREVQMLRSSYANATCTYLMV